MAEAVNQSKADKELLEVAIKRLKRAVEAEADNRRKAVDDLKFLYGDQWDNEQRLKRERRGRPTLQVNILTKYTEQVGGEMRRNKTQIKARPVDTKASSHVAKIREGIIRNIEYQSSAESIYDQSGKMMIDCGYGAWRVLTKKSEINPFMQDIYLEAVPNPFSVYLDPDAKDSHGSDAEYGFVIDRMLREDFKSEYGFEAPMSGDKPQGADHGAATEYLMSDSTHVVVMEYFYKTHNKRKMAQLTDGQIMTLDEAKKYIEQAEQSYATLKASGGALNANYIPKIAKETETEETKIKWAKITESHVLERADWPSGKYIPLILDLGREVNIEGKRCVFGLIRNSKDAQKLKNYWETSLAETVALAPKAQWLLTPTMIKGFETDYAASNEENFPYLKFNPDPSMPGAYPKRNDPAQVSPGLFAEVARADENIKSCMGMYNADVGDQGPEMSGRAIYARQIPGDTSTYVFLDNHSKAIEYSGKIVNDLIKYVYDTERDARMRNPDGSETFVPINTTVGKAMQKIKEDPAKYAGMDVDKLKQAGESSGMNADFNLIGEGEYDVIITTGPTFATQRAEAASAMLQLAQVSATMNPLDKFFMVKAMDFDGSDDYAEAIRKTIPYGVLPPRPGEKPPEQPRPSPAEQMALQSEKLKLETQVIDRQVQLEKQIVEAERRRTEQLQQMVELVKLIAEAQSGMVQRQAAQMLNRLQAQVDTPMPAIGQTGSENA